MLVAAEPPSPAGCPREPSDPREIAIWPGLVRRRRPEVEPGLVASHCCREYERAMSAFGYAELEPPQSGLLDRDIESGPEPGRAAVAASGAGEECGHVRLGLCYERRLEVDPSGTSFRLVAPGGEVELVVRVTSEGPVLTFRAASLEIGKTRELRVEVDELLLRARRAASIECLGGLRQRVAGESEIWCEGSLRVEAGQVSITSHTGPMALDSTQDLALNGERVLINC